MQNSISPIINFADEQGIEAAYSIAVNEWFDLTFDAQYIDPAAGDNDRLLALGVRARFRL